MTGKSRTTRTRLTPEDWIRAGLEALIEEGPSGLRIARLARKLGVTPGSFYWHFEDRARFRDKLLEFWLNQVLSVAGELAKRSGKGPEQIRALGRILAERGLPAYDDAMRKWAVSDPVVAGAVAKADALRIRRVTAMFREAGFGQDVALQRARMLLWVHVGSIGAKPADRQRVAAELLETLLQDAARSPRRTAPPIRRSRTPATAAPPPGTRTG